MKRKVTKNLIKSILLFWVATSSISAQTGGPYILDWGTSPPSAGGQYKLTGTIGQPDAAYSAGGNYELFGGFWPGGPLCIVEFEDFARFAEQWLYTGTGLAGDIDKDGDVDIEDLKRFADYWLACCPYNWPLR